MSESKTPRTDMECWPSPHGVEEFCKADFARTLELELNEAKRKLNAIELVRGTHDCGCEVCGMGSAVCPASASSYALAIVEAKDQLTTAQQEIAELRKAICEYFTADSTGSFAHMSYAKAEMRKVLAKGTKE